MREREDFPLKGRGCRTPVLIPSCVRYGMNPLTTTTMAIINDHFLKLQAGYLFPEINRRVNAFIQAHPEAAPRLIRCGIGDVTEPLPQAAIEAMHEAVDDLPRMNAFTATARSRAISG